MKAASTIARYLLALTFLVFGLNGFLPFIRTPLPPGIGGQFLGILINSHYLAVVSAFEVVAAVLLAANRYVAFGLTLLGPIVVNIVLYHALMDPSGLPVAAVVCVLWLLTAFSVRLAFQGLFRKSPQDLHRIRGLNDAYATHE